jgi:hypothetical protein
VSPVSIHSGARRTSDEACLASGERLNVSISGGGYMNCICSWGMISLSHFDQELSRPPRLQSTRTMFGIGTTERECKTVNLITELVPSSERVLFRIDGSGGDASRGLPRPSGGSSTECSRVPRQFRITRTLLSRCSVRPMRRS